MAEETAGDPMGSLKWTRKSTHQASRELKRLKVPASPGTVARLLRASAFSLKANRKMIAQTHHPERDRQFKYLTKMKQQFAANGDPTLSVDAKKKELIGNFKNAGKLWCREAPAVADHDFRSDADAIVNPYGLYDVQRNSGLVVVGTSYDTPEFAADAIALWLKTPGEKLYPQTKHLLLLADTGGSNGCRARAWKYALQTRICNAFHLAVTVCHYPTGASKWNPIEHRLFGPLSNNWAGQPLRSLEIMLKFIRTTKTKTGLKVRARLNRKAYPKGTTISKAQMARLNLKPHRVLPQWNYTIFPQGDV